MSLTKTFYLIILLRFGVYPVYGDFFQLKVQYIFLFENFIFMEIFVVKVRLGGKTLGTTVNSSNLHSTQLGFCFEELVSMCSCSGTDVTAVKGGCRTKYVSSLKKNLWQMKNGGSKALLVTSELVRKVRISG